MAQSSRWRNQKGLTTKRASGVLQKCLSESLGRLHALREAVLLRSVQALIAGRRLTLTDVVRAWHTLNASPLRPKHSTAC